MLLGLGNVKGDLKRRVKSHQVMDLELTSGRLLVSKARVFYKVLSLQKYFFVCVSNVKGFCKGSRSSVQFN
jgi:hypothetical protein